MRRIWCTHVLPVYFSYVQEHWVILRVITCFINADSCFKVKLSKQRTVKHEFTPSISTVSMVLMCSSFCENHLKVSGLIVGLMVTPTFDNYCHVII